MRIISKFKDYYDRGARYGVDLTRVYVRETIVMNAPVYMSSKNKYLKTFTCYNGMMCIVGFCGKLYLYGDYTHLPVLMSRENVKHWILHGEDAIGYSIAIDEKHLKLRGVTRPMLVKNRDYGINYNRRTAEEMLSSEMLKGLFVEHNVPTFLLCMRKDDDSAIRRDRLVLNPCLKDVAFYKVIGPDRAFQEIEMFISNQLASDTKVDVPVGDDNVIRDSKGFDKHSFRKEKKT